MDGEMLLNTYTILVVLAIAILIWITIIFLRKPKGTTKLLSQSQENLTGLGAFMMALCSIGLSIGFSLSLATSIFIGVLFVSLFWGFCIAEFTASFHLAKAWNDGRLGRVAAAMFLLVGGAAISIIAGQALIATKVDEAQAKRLQASEAYQLALKERQSAQEQVKKLALDSSVVTQAQQQLTQFERQLANLMNQQDQTLQVRNACPPDYLTKCIKPANQTLAALDSKISVTESAILQEKALLDQFEKYQHAQSYAADLSSQPLPPSVVTDSVLPGIKALSIVLTIPTEVVGAHVFLFLAVFGELGGIILFYLWGASRLERALLTIPNGMTLNGEFTSSHPNFNNPSAPPPLAELTTTLNQLQQQMKELEYSKRVTSSPVSQPVSSGSDGEVNEWESTDPVTTSSRNNTTSRNHESSRQKPSVQRVCAHEDCSNEFVPRSYNHKFCSNDCRAKAHGFNDENHVKKQMITKRAHQ